MRIASLTRHVAACAGLAVATLAPVAANAQAQALPAPAAAPVAPAASAAARALPNKVVVAGTVPDEASRQAIVVKLRELYGSDRVVDQLGVGNVVAPANWADHVGRLIATPLKQVSRGQLAVNGNTVDIKGEVASEAQRQQVVTHLAAQLNPTYAVRNGLRVAVADQEQVDGALANRIIEFEESSATLTAGGRDVLDQLVPVLQKLQNRRFEIIGHTDGTGSRGLNIALSKARADAVKAYLAGKGVRADAISASGAGPDRPIAANDTAECRARNRRIEFRVGQ